MRVDAGVTLTHEEMAQFIEQVLRDYSIYSADRNNLTEIAAALRREQWRTIDGAPEVSRFGFLAGHVGSERIDHCFGRDTAVRLMHTHYRELPAPPEGV